MSRKTQSPAEKKAYAFQHVIGHLAVAEPYDRLWELLESRPFLAAQAEYTHGFQNGSRDLETHVLAAAIAQADWPRFLRYALVATNLREIATELTQEPILRNLVRHGRGGLAGNLVGQLADPQTRARARAVVVGTAAEDGGSQSLNPDEELQSLLEDLDEVPPPANDADAEAWLVTLRTLARHLDPAWLHGCWAGWVARLASETPAPDREKRVQGAWQSLAESWIERDLGADCGLWQALGAIRRERLLAFLPHRLAASPAEDGTLLAEPLPPPWEDDQELLWHVRLAILGRRVRTDRAPAELAWTLLADLPVSWSEELAAAGRELWPRLGTERVVELAATVDDAMARTALIVTALEGSPEAGLRELFRRTVAEIDDPSRKLHWTLRYLATEPTSTRKRRQVGSLSRTIERLRYRVPGEDLARFLDLVAAELPAELERQLENVAASPDSCAMTLRTLASESRHRAVLDQLLARAEDYSAALSFTASEGFILRRQVLIRVAQRLVCELEDPSGLDRAASQLLPDEEDQLRSALVDALLAVAPPDEMRKPSFSALARQACQGIHSPRRRALTRLRVVSDPGTLQESTAPAALYEAAAANEVAEDEWFSLAPLLERPDDPAALAARHVDRVRDSNRRVRALIDLARHALAYQRRVLPANQQDPAAALLPLTEAVGEVTGEERLVALTPELAALGAESGIGRAVAEIQEAILRVLRLGTVKMSLRFEALETLIAGLGKIMLGEREDPPPRRCKAVALLFRWLVQLPAQRDLPADELREVWPELLPIVLAAADGLPPLAMGYLWRPMRTRFCVDAFPTLTKLLGLEPMWAFCRGWEKLLPGKLLQQLRTPWARGAEGFAAWLDPVQEQACEAFFSSDPEELQRLAGSVVEQDEPNERELRTLAYLLCRRGPDQVAALCRRLPGGPARDDFCLRLLRRRWLPAEAAREVAAQIDDPSLARQAELWQGMGKVDDPAWMKALAWLVGQGIDALDPRHEPLRRGLRKADRETSCRALAQVTRQALAEGGRLRGERALRWWLQAYLGCGEPQPQRFEDAAAAMRGARALHNRPGNEGR